MDIQLMIQSTPNPNALKFVVNQPVRTEGNFTYTSIDACAHNPLARGIFEITPHINEVYFFDNYITVTQNGQDDWDSLEEKIKTVILTEMPSHDANFDNDTPLETSSTPPNASPEMQQMDAILDQTVRPALQMDGGDLTLIHYDNNVLTVQYHGACGSCPSAAMGTLNAIENILKNEFNPDISVQMA